MKVLRSGSMAKDITFTCEHCGCVFSLDDYNDWSGDWYHNCPPFNENNWKMVFNYKIDCPECNAYLNIGANPAEGNPNLCSYNHIFNRPDWNKRYSILNKENPNVENNGETLDMLDEGL